MPDSNRGTKAITEAQLQTSVLDLAGYLGWRRAHFRPARVMRGGREIYETPVAADGKGFPDLILVRDRVLFVELKSDTGSIAGEQAAWLHWLKLAGAQTYVWRPDDWTSGEIERTLRGTLMEAV